MKREILCIPCHTDKKERQGNNPYPGEYFMTVVVEMVDTS